MDMDAVVNGLEVWVKIGGKKLAGKVLETAFSHEGNYLQCKVEITEDNPLHPSQPIVYIYPKPIQSYRLSYRGDHEPKPRRNRKQEQAEALARIQEIGANISRYTAI